MDKDEQKRPEKYGKICPKCGGMGIITWGPNDDIMNCPVCKGRGTVKRDLQARVVTHTAYPTNMDDATDGED